MLSSIFTICFEEGFDPVHTLRINAVSKQFLLRLGVVFILLECYPQHKLEIFRSTPKGGAKRFRNGFGKVWKCKNQIQNVGAMRDLSFGKFTQDIAIKCVVLFCK